MKKGIMKIGKIRVAGIAMFAVAAAIAAGTNLTDVLDGNDGWAQLNNAQFVASANAMLLPTAGTNFMRHSVGANWSGSAVYKDLGITLQEGLYEITLDAGHDGNVNRPFADVGGNRVRVGFLDATATLPGHAEVRDAISAFPGLAGVEKRVIDEPIPNAGWKQWKYIYKVDAGSPAIGTDVYFGIQAQSANAGGVQAAFDNLRITFEDNRRTLKLIGFPAP